MDIDKQHIHHSLETNNAKKNALEKLVLECKSDLKNSAWETITHLPFEKLNTLVLNKSNRNKKSYFDTILFQTRCVKKGLTKNTNGTLFSIDGAWGNETTIKFQQFQIEKNTNNTNKDKKNEIATPTKTITIEPKEVHTNNIKNNEKKQFTIEEFKKSSAHQFDLLAYNAKRKICVEYLLNKGYPEKAVYGIVGNIEKESHFKCNARGDRNLKNHAHGFCQRRGDRFYNLKAYAENRKRHRSEPAIQLDFMIDELEKDYHLIIEKLKSPNISIEEATFLFAVYYERPDGSTKKEGGKRRKKTWEEAKKELVQIEEDKKNGNKSKKNRWLYDRIENAIATEGLHTSSTSNAS